MPDRYVPYGHQLIEEDDIDAVAAVLRSDYLTTGPMIGRFEAAVLEMDVERAALDPFENLVEAARERLAEVAPFAKHALPFPPLHAR